MGDHVVYIYEAHRYYVDNTNDAKSFRPWEVLGHRGGRRVQGDRVVIRPAEPCVVTGLKYIISGGLCWMTVLAVVFVLHAACELCSVCCMCLTVSSE